MRILERATARPALSVLAPAVVALTVFGWAHQDLVFVSLCSLALIASYFHHGSLSLPTRSRWFETVCLALVAGVFCLIYFITILQAGKGLPYFPRQLYKPWLISMGGMMQALTIVWLWHLPGPAGRQTGPIIGCTGLLVASSCNLLDTSLVALNLLAIFGGTIVFALLALGSSLQSGRAASSSEHIWKSVKVLGCIVLISSGTWIASSGVRQLDQLIDRFMLNLSQGTRYTDILGVGNHLRIERQRRITLSPRIVATFTPIGTVPDFTHNPVANLTYVRAQVLSTYQDQVWISQPTPHHPLQGNWAPDGNSSYSLPSNFDGSRWYTASTPLDLPTNQVDVNLHANLQGAIPLPYSVQQVRIPATQSCLLTSEDLLQCGPSEQLTAYRLETQLPPSPLPYGIGAAVRPLARIESEPEFRLAIQQARTAPVQILEALRPLAQQLAGADRQPSLEVAQTIQAYFRQNYRYSQDVNLAKIGDPIVDFVLNQRPAYCEYFASGMALMLRALDIPSRVVGGFLVREYNPFAGQWIVRQQDAHAWVEVFDYARDQWVAFDPTPAAVTSTPRRHGIWAVFDKGFAWVELQLHNRVVWAASIDLRSAVKHVWSRTTALLYRPHLIAILTILTLVILAITKRTHNLLLTAIQHWWKAQGAPKKPPAHLAQPDPVIAAAHHQFTRVAQRLEQMGAPIHDAETLAAYLHRLTTARQSDCHPSSLSHLNPKSPRLADALLPTLEAFSQSYTALRFQPHRSRQNVSGSFSSGESVTATGVIAQAEEIQAQLTRLDALADEIEQIHERSP